MTKLIAQGCLAAWGVTAGKAMLFPVVVVIVKMLLHTGGGPSLGIH